MRALVCHGGDDLRVEELPEPSPGPGQVVLDVRLAGICGSDLHAYRGHPGPRRPPLVLGHEAVGTVGADGRFAVFPLAPIYVMVTAAFKTQRDFLAQPFAPFVHPTLDGFRTALSAQFPRWLFNSTFVTVSAVLLTLVLAATAAWGFAHWSWPGRDTVLAALVSLMVVPPVVLLVPLFVLGAKLGWISTFRLLILIYVGLMLPFSMYMLTNFFRAIPSSLVEAATIDGASSWTVFRRVVLPLSTAPLVTLAVVNLLYVWNELLLALVFLQDDAKKTLMVGITGFQSRYSLNIPVIMAGLTLATLPIIVLYVFGQRFFVRGLLAGAIKGE